MALGFLRVLLGAADRLAAQRPALLSPERGAALAAAQLAVFVFIMTGLVFETQHRTNSHIGSYPDALYCTVATLTSFRPNKARFTCPSCGLQRHEPDAARCRA